MVDPVLFVFGECESNMTISCPLYMFKEVSLFHLLVIQSDGVHQVYHCNIICNSEKGIILSLFLCSRVVSIYEWDHKVAAMSGVEGY
jgi:hypothetical protein